MRIRLHLAAEWMRTSGLFASIVPKQHRRLFRGNIVNCSELLSP